MIKHSQKRPYKSFALALVLALLTAAGLASAAWAAAGDLDTSFSGDGRVTTELSGAGGYDKAEAIAAQPDGKLVTVGRGTFNRASESWDEDFIVTRYNANGTLDTSFDGDGKAFPFSGFGSHEAGEAVAIQPDGKVVVAGSAKGDAAVARYNADGSLDTSFDGDGKATKDYGNDLFGTVRAIAIRSDGKIVTGVYKSGAINGVSIDHFEVVRYNADGSLDTAFGEESTQNPGTRIGYTRGPGGISEDLALQPDGKIVMAGHSPIGGIIVARYNEDGSVDHTFGDDDSPGDNVRDGSVFTGDIGSPGGWDEAYAVAVQSDGKILVAGESSTYQEDVGSDYDFALVSYNDDGTLDTGFDGDGAVITDMGGRGDWAYDLIIQQNGKLVVAGAGGDSSDTGTSFALARYNPTGSLDTSFSGDGKLLTGFGGDPTTTGSQVNGLARQSDGKLVAAGFFGDPQANEDFALARYLSDDSTTDTTPPTVSLIGPADGATVSGTSVALKAEASDDKGVADARFYIWKNGAWSLVGTDTTAGGASGKEYSYTWDSTTVSDGTNYFYVDARDQAGNVTFTNYRTITVDNSSSGGDTTSPTVTTWTPTGTDIRRATPNIIATFSEKVNKNSVLTPSATPLQGTSSTVALFDIATRKKVGATVTCDADPCQKVTLAPKKPLAKKTKYKAIISTGVKDLSGNWLDQSSDKTGYQSKSWTFTTGTKF